MSQRLGREEITIKPDPKYDGVEAQIRADRTIKLNGFTVEEYHLESGEARVFIDGILCSSTYSEAVRAVAGYRRWTP